MQINDDAREIILFMSILDEAMAAAGLEDVELMCCDSAGWDAQKMFMAPIVDSASAQYLDVITGHSYTSQPGAPVDTTDLPKWNTEAGPGISFITSWYDSGAQKRGMSGLPKPSPSLNCRLISSGKVFSSRICSRRCILSMPWMAWHRLLRESLGVCHVVETYSSWGSTRCCQWGCWICNPRRGGERRRVNCCRPDEQC